MFTTCTKDHASYLNGALYLASSTEKVLAQVTCEDLMYTATNGAQNPWDACACCACYSVLACVGVVVWFWHRVLMLVLCVTVRDCARVCATVRDCAQASRGQGMSACFTFFCA